MTTCFCSVRWEFPVLAHPIGAWWIEIWWLLEFSTEIRWRWFELCGIVHFHLEVTIRRWVDCGHREMDMVSNDPANKWPKVCQENTPKPAAAVAAWAVGSRQDGGMLSCYLQQILTQPSECWRWNWDSRDQAALLESSTFQLVCSSTVASRLHLLCTHR